VAGRSVVTVLSTVVTDVVVSVEEIRDPIAIPSPSRTRAAAIQASIRLERRF
jgi:hypothetical protein